MKSWFLVRGYTNDFIEAEMKKVKFTSKNRNNKRGKSLKRVPFAMTYHPKLKSMNKVIKYLDLLYMDKEVKRVFTSKPMISFQSHSWNPPLPPLIKGEGGGEDLPKIESLVGSTKIFTRKGE